jgi:hypothetical protein
LESFKPRARKTILEKSTSYQKVFIPQIRQAILTDGTKDAPKSSFGRGRHASPARTYSSLLQASTIDLNCYL